MNNRCQKLYLRDARCQHRVYGASPWCRWHKVIQEFRGDLRKRPLLYAHVLMFGSCTSLVAALNAMSIHHRHGLSAWLLLAMALMGMSVKLFADGIIAQDHPFAQFALWGKALAAGLGVEIAFGLALLYMLVDQPAVAQAMIGAVTSSPLLERYGPFAIKAGLALWLWSMVTIWVGRVLFLRRPWLQTMIALVMISALASAARTEFWLSQVPAPATGPFAATKDPAIAPTLPTVPVARRVPDESLMSMAASQAIPPTRSGSGPTGASAPATAADAQLQWQRKLFEPVIGDWPAWSLFALSFAAFVIAEVVNMRLRRSPHNIAAFRQTMWPSLFVCMSAATIGLWAARYLLVHAGWPHRWGFVFLSLLISSLAAWVGTRILLALYLRPLQELATQSADARSSSQALILFYVVGHDLQSGSARHRSLETMLNEIQSALLASRTGTIVDVDASDPYLVVEMRGSRADNMLKALSELLRSIALPAGTFLVLRRGQGLEERIELN